MDAIDPINEVNLVVRRSGDPTSPGTAVHTEPPMRFPSPEGLAS
ncbi:hypothetical protein [Actinoplanes sp. M2I2]|nr:hypothetical protein [Actinoplanes sp. M2I2]